VTPIGTLPANAAPIAAGLTSATPTMAPALYTPTECALRGMINSCLAYVSRTGTKCVAVLVTDGEPTRCDQNPANLSDIVAEGAARGVATFAVALPGAQQGLPLLQQVAAAGGTTLVDLTGGGSQAAILTALNTIRSQVVTETVVSTPLDCQWRIPAAPEGQRFDPGKVNVTFTVPGSAPVPFGRVDSEADCGRAAGAAAWYYDDPSAPTEIAACASTCDVIKATRDARVDVEFGCATIPAKLN
jgi:hypothetical protein